MSYIICFWDKSKIQVDDAAGEKLKIAKREGRIDTFEIGHSIYSVKGVEKIMPKQEAYTAFPMDWETLNVMDDSKISNNILSIENPKPKLVQENEQQKRLGNLKQQTKTF